jgi:NADH:ubiquinone oxidoreductase subunit C
MSTELETQLERVPGAMRLERRRDGLWMVAPDLDVRAMAQTMSQQGAFLSTITALPAGEGETELIYHYRVNGQAINFKARTQNNMALSIAPLVPAANWIEREIHDLYDVEFEDHPHLARLLRPPQLARGFFRDDTTAE